MNHLHYWELFMFSRVSLPLHMLCTLRGMLSTCHLAGILLLILYNQAQLPAHSHPFMLWKFLLCARHCTSTLVTKPNKHNPFPGGTQNQMKLDKYCISQSVPMALSTFTFQWLDTMTVYFYLTAQTNAGQHRGLGSAGSQGLRLILLPFLWGP